ncbi:GNAT family N-acetyltransferase [Geojedonia litorea]|uniref:GNAT family N-acetyltransferase n=1 Tax=Geojedonia litorea TaxID=1268269 RepID=A0ABV9N4P6_9FLAO
MIRKATIIDVAAVLEITRACARHMINQNIFQWNEHYPNAAAFETDIKRGELFVLEEKSKVVACIVVSTYMDDIYKPVAWLTPNKNNLYIHRLAVHPDVQGRGYAQQLISFSEEFGRKNKFVSIRLDTFSKNPRNQKFYECRGYQRLEDIYFPKQSEHPFYCYELVL